MVEIKQEEQVVELEGKGEEKAGTIKEQERKGEKGNRFGRVCVWICLLFEMKIQSVCRITLDWQALRSQPLICKSVCVSVSVCSLRKTALICTAVM